MSTIGLKTSDGGRRGQPQERLRAGGAWWRSAAVDRAGGSGPSDDSARTARWRDPQQRDGTMVHGFVRSGGVATIAITGGKASKALRVTARGRARDSMEDALSIAPRSCRTRRRRPTKPTCGRAAVRARVELHPRARAIVLPRRRRRRYRRNPQSRRCRRRRSRSALQLFPTPRGVGADDAPVIVPDRPRADGNRSPRRRSTSGRNPRCRSPKAISATGSFTEGSTIAAPGVACSTPRGRSPTTTAEGRRR